jgi:hypothetical protein
MKTAVRDNTVNRLLAEAGLPSASAKEYLNLAYLGNPPEELDGEALEELYEACIHVVENEAPVEQWEETGMVVRPEDVAAARRRNALYRNNRKNKKPSNRG